MKYILTTIAALLFATNCMAWGQKGHDTTCAIAQQHLTDAAKTRIAEILDGKSILYWSNWLDNAVHTPEYEYAKTWHYKNIDADQAYADVEPFETGDVVTALTELQLRLTTFEALPAEEAADQKQEEALALKMFVHLMGDLHQPMHMGHATDLGGNRIMVKYFGRDANLHAIWDTDLVESAHAWSHTEWVEEIDRLSEEESMSIAAGNFDTWGEETFNLCREVYNDTPEGNRVSYDYVAKWTPVIERQFVRGGHRLAHVLNSIFQ